MFSFLVNWVSSFQPLFFLTISWTWRHVYFFSELSFINPTIVFRHNFMYINLVNADDLTCGGVHSYMSFLLMFSRNWFLYTQTVYRRISNHPKILAWLISQDYGYCSFISKTLLNERVMDVWKSYMNYTAYK